ncbi:hypothetical protein [Geminicoccus flavidas]|uniref:hypothetical protein n=1 Tax=Geminicoccus flavidas TaxID=2506407 RepID=UPI00135CCD29|nr:hypothetical protein [Geminicoccus flavidas]
MRWNKLPGSFSACGMRTMTIFYESALVTKKAIDLAKIDKVAAQIRSARPPLVTLDIECWDPATASGRDKLIRVIERIRSKVPSSVKLGYWGIMPGYAYPDYVAGGSRLARQRTSNRSMRPLAAKCDWIMPSLYTYDGNRTRWAKFADIILAEANAYGKPVMPWLWPQFHDQSPDKKLRYKLIPGEFFRSELEKARSRADAVCLWGTRAKSGGSTDRLVWQPKASWWRETKAFLKTTGHDIKGCKI